MEGFLVLVGTVIGAVITGHYGKNKELTTAQIESVIEGADRAVYKEVEKLNRDLKKELSDENLKFQIEWEQKKIDAEVVSKSRMQWMDNTKLITSSFLSDTLKLSSILIQFTSNIKVYNSFNTAAQITKAQTIDKMLPKSQREEAKEVYNQWNDVDRVRQINQQKKIAEEINLRIEELFKNYVLIKMNFSDNEKNNEIVNLVFAIYERVKEFSLTQGGIEYASDAAIDHAIRESEKIRNANSKNVEQLASLLREYYKKEWEKVKSGK